MTPAQALQKYFGYANFKPGQLEIINSIIANHDTLAILATGGGKSICYQIPGLIFKGTTVVISPLISLMKDQVDALLAKNISATYLNSSLSQSEYQLRIKNISNQQYKFIYVAPERLLVTKFLAVVNTLSISFISIDEAHCISLWGHDFRPAYLKINRFINQVHPRPVVAAFSATATLKTQTDINTSLELIKPSQFINSTKRNNLFLNVIHCQSNFEKELALFRILNHHQNQAGIIYTSSRKTAQYVAELINHYSDEVRAMYYHGELTTDHKDKTQTLFLQDKIKIIVATNAFGMGIDKANVRFVIHFQITGSIENYYQEIGRAGRDNQHSSCYLLYYQFDIGIQQSLINTTSLTNQQLLDHKHQLLMTMCSYASSLLCRQLLLTHYFGKKQNNTCQNCDNCTHQPPTASNQEQQIFQALSMIQAQLAKKFNITQEEILTNKTKLLIALHQPLSEAQFLKMPGIGYGWVEKWYNIILNSLKQTNSYVNDTQATYK